MNTRVLLLLMLGAASVLPGCGDDLPPPTDTELLLAGVTVTTVEDTPLAFELTAVAAEGLEFTATITPPAHGTLALEGLAVTYTPAADFHGTEELTATVTATSGATSTAPVRIVVASVNEAPVRVDDLAAGFAGDAARMFAPGMLLANDTDVDGDPLTITAVDQAIGGAVALVGANVVFTPGQAFAGTGGFRYTISDGTSTATAIVTITGDADEDPPIGGADAVTTLEEIALAIGPATLLANDADPEGQPLTVTAVSAPIAGTVVLTSGLVVFTPTRDATGAGGFTYTLSDGTLTTTATVVVTILPVNDAPIAVADALATELPTRLPTVVPAAALLGNDTDVDGDTLSITAVTAGTNCAVTLGASGVTITPTARGPLSFTYVMSDGHGATDTAQVTAVGGNTLCGNGTLDTVETCDDGANEDSDGCSADCYVETCGDGIVNANLVMPQVVTLNIAAEDVDSMTLRINGHDEPLATAPTGACDELTYVITTPAVLAAIVAGTNDIEIAHTGLISDVKMRIDTVQGPQFFHPRESLVPGCDTAEAADPVKTTFAFQSGVVTEQCDAGAQNANQPNAPCRTNCVAPRCGDRLCDTATENPAWCSDCTLYGDGQCDEDGTCEVHESTRSCPADCTDCDNDGTCEYGEGIACGDCPAFACFEDSGVKSADGKD